MADDGLSRAISPSHTTGDGDTVFSLATATWQGQADVTTIGALAADALSEAIVRAAVHADIVWRPPAARDLAPCLTLQVICNSECRIQNADITLARVDQRTRVCILNSAFCIDEPPSRAPRRLLAGVVGLGLWTARFVRTSSEFFVAGPQPGTGPRPRVDAGREHRRRRHGQRRRTRLSRRAERVVVERLGGSRVVRARLLGGPAALDARQGARLLHDRRLPGVPLRPHRPRGDHGPGLLRLPVDPCRAADRRRRDHQRPHRRAALGRRRRSAAAS